jgi:hypothetical protein
LQLLDELRNVSLRDQVRFIAVSQPFAGAFLNAVPSRKPFRLPTWALRIAIQRRLGLPLSIATEERRNRKGQLLDVYGDVALNAPDTGFGSRHDALLAELVSVVRSVFGRRVVKEPRDHRSYNAGHRPDFNVADGALDGGHIIGELKLTDQMTAEATNIGRRGARVAFGNSRPDLRKQVLGRAERGAPQDGRFDTRTGRGYVSSHAGDYAEALRRQHTVLCLIFCTYGGFGPEAVKFINGLAKHVDNKLNSPQYEETTWSARSWVAFQTQKLSVKLHRAVSWQVGTEHGLGVCQRGMADPRDGE